MTIKHTVANLSDSVNKIATGLLASASVNDKHQIVLKDFNLAEFLPEGVTVEDIKKVQDAERDFAKAAFVVTGALGQQHLKDHKDVAEVELSRVNFGKAHVQATYSRSSDVGVGEKKTTRYGHLTGKVVSTATKSSASDSALSDIKAHYEEAGAKLFGGK